MSHYCRTARLQLPRNVTPEGCRRTHIRGRCGHGPPSGTRVLPISADLVPTHASVRVPAAHGARLAILSRGPAVLAKQSDEARVRVSAVSFPGAHRQRLALQQLAAGRRGLSEVLLDETDLRSVGHRVPGDVKSAGTVCGGRNR